MIKLQESVGFISTKFDEYKKERKTKRKIKENLKIFDKLAILEKQTDKQGQYSRHNCILPNGIPESIDEVTGDIAFQTICENICESV